MINGAVNQLGSVGIYHNPKYPKSVIPYKYSYRECRKKWPRFYLSTRWFNHVEKKKIIHINSVIYMIIIGVKRDNFVKRGEL